MSNLSEIEGLKKLFEDKPELFILIDLLARPGTEEIFLRNVIKLSPLTKDHALRILEKPSLVQEDSNAVILDDHRWIHMWANTIVQKNKLFLTKEQLKKLHDIYVTEFARRGFDSGIDHKSPLPFSALQFSRGLLEKALKNRQPFKLDEEGISFIGSSIAGKKEPGDLDIIYRGNKNEGLKEKLLETMPEEIRDSLSIIWDESGPNGPYIPAWELWAIPKKEIKVKEPRYLIQPLSPFKLPEPDTILTQENIHELFADSYFCEPIQGLRLAIHRRENEVIAFDRDLDEYELPKEIIDELTTIKDPTTFILDGFLLKEAGDPIFHIIDMPWWRESQHVLQNAEIRRVFILKLEDSKHIKKSLYKYFENRGDLIEFLKGENKAFLLIPGSSPYPLDSPSSWILFNSESKKLAAQSSDDQIRSLVDGDRWESMNAQDRFELMVKREKIDPLYPFAQLKTTKKGYASHEVFGLKSVNQLAEEIFKVPNKEAIEVKVDGFRVQIHKKGDQVRLFTEGGHEITERIPTIVEDAKKLHAQSVVLDSEATPYDETLRNLGRAGAAPAFAEGAKGKIDDSLWALHVFDLLYLDGKDLHKVPYQERREKLRGLELPVRDVPKSKDDFRIHLWENHVYWAASAEQMIKFSNEVSKVAASEGAMFKQSDSEYRLSGTTPLWAKMKLQYEIDALIVGIKQQDHTFNYIGAIGPVSGVKEAESAPLESAKDKKFVKWKNKIYSVLGKTFNTNLKSDVGGIIRVTVKDVRKIDENVYHWFHPQVLEVREDKTKPDPLGVAQTISRTTAQQQEIKGQLVCEICGEPASFYFGGGCFCKACYEKERKKKRAYLIDARYADQSSFGQGWAAIENESGFDYLQVTSDLPTKLMTCGCVTVVGGAIDRDLIDGFYEAGLDYTYTESSTIEEFRDGPLLLQEPEYEETAEIDVDRLREFYDEIRSHPVPHMKLSCCKESVILKPLKFAQDPYLTYPDESKTWNYVLQFHIRGLSVHGDFRAQISKDQLIGWTWDLGKSLIKLLLRRLNPEILTKVGLTKDQIKGMEIRDVSKKLDSTSEGRALKKILSEKTQKLSMKSLETLCMELWREEAEPIWKDPTKKILTQRKQPEPAEWLTYEGEVPPGAVGATAELEGTFIILDRGTIEYGTQKSYYDEYYLKGKLLNGRFFVRRLATRPKWQLKESFAWMTFRGKETEKPYAISKRAVDKGWMPPKGISALPKAIRDQIPEEYRYWEKNNAKEVRDNLVEALKGKLSIKLQKGLRFMVKRVWHRGPEIQRGQPVVRYWLIIHDGRKVVDAWDFGEDHDPLEEEGITSIRREGKGLEDLIKKTGELPPDHPASQTKKLKNQHDTSDEGSVKIIADTNSFLRIQLEGEVLKGLFVFIKEDPHGEMWIFQKSELPEPKKAMLLSGLSDGKMLHLAAGDFKSELIGDLLILEGAAIKPGEVIPMDGKPTYFTYDGIKEIWKTTYRQPIVVLHGELKGDVIGFIDKTHFDSETGWGWIDRAVIWHPMGIKLIMEKKLPDWSIEVLPRTVWDPEHQHEHVIGGRCVGCAVVTEGACKTCKIDSARPGTITISPGKIYKFGMVLEKWIENEYWSKSRSIDNISKELGIPKSTTLSWMKNAGIPSRNLQESRKLRELQLAGRATITALGTGAFSDIPRDDCPQCMEAKKGGKSRRNFTATLFSVGADHLLVNAPEGIGDMLGSKRVKPQWVLLEHIHEDVIAGLHELRPLKPNVFASKQSWEYLRRHFRALSGEKGSFEEIYDFPRYVIKDQAFSCGPFTIGPIEVEHAKPGDPEALGFKIMMGDQIIWHCSDVLSIPNREKVLEGVTIFIGDGASLKRGIIQERDDSRFGHTSIEEQIKWAQEADIPRIYFTQIGHVGKTHDELNEALKEMAPNAVALYDGAEISLEGANPGALHSQKFIERLLSGKSTIIVRTKPYSQYAKQAIYLLSDDEIHGLYVEGYPEGPLQADEVKNMREEHGLSNAEWDKEIGDAKQVWIYRPRLLRRVEPPKQYRKTVSAGPYVTDVVVQR